MITKIKLTAYQRHLLRRYGEFRLGLNGNAKQRRKTKRALSRCGKYEVIDKYHWRNKDVVIKLKEQQ